MPSGVLARGLAVLEILAKSPSGLPFHEIAQKLGLPKSATHRVLTELADYHYVRQTRDHGDYALTLRLCSLGLAHLTRMGVADISHPILDQLAQASGEVARLSIVDGDDLVWVAKVQGNTTSALRFDPDQGGIVDLISTASGHAWLSRLSEEIVADLVTKQGEFAPRQTDEGPNVPRSMPQLMTQLHKVRLQGFAIVSEAVHTGIAAVAAPVVHEALDEVIAVVSIAGPHIRLTDERLVELGPVVVSAAQTLAAACAGSPFLQQAVNNASQRQRLSAPESRARTKK